MKILLVCLALLAGCGTLREDTSPAPFDTGHKRVESLICGSHELGENGCAFEDGVISSDLKIYKITDGSVSIISTGCGVDYSTEYVDDSEWLEIDLKALLGDRLQNDCVLQITQQLKWSSKSKFPFPIRPLVGTVTLGTCPKDVKCTMDFVQSFTSDRTQKFNFSEEASGEFMLSGCGKELISPRKFNEPLILPLGGYFTGQAPGGCVYILAAIGNNLHKQYKKVWYYLDSAVPLKAPSIKVKKGKVCYYGDENVMVSTVNGVPVKGANGKYRPSPDGDTLRFYTSQSRVLTVFVKNGAIVWIK